MIADLKDGAKRNPIWFGAVAAVTGVQAFFAWEFWAGVSPDPTHQAALRILGLSFVAGEVVALDMASRAALDREPARANTLRALWAVLALTTFTADINALSNVLKEGDRPREAALARFEANQAHIADLRARIDKADDAFDHALMSVPAYDAAIDGKQREVRTAQRENARTWRILALERELTTLAAERAAAAEIATLQARLSALESTPETHATRPADAAITFAPMAHLLTNIARQTQSALGHTPTAHVSNTEVRDGMAWVAAIGMKLMLTFGVWVGLHRGRGARVAPSPADSAETRPTPPSSPAPASPPPTGPAPSPGRDAPRPSTRRVRAGSAVFTRTGQRFGR